MQFQLAATSGTWLDVFLSVAGQGVPAERDVSRRNPVAFIMRYVFIIPGCGWAH